MPSPLCRWRKSYYGLILMTVSISYMGFLRGSWLSLLVFALSSWLLGAMGHDGAHFACSHSPLINGLCGLGISLIASPLLWYHQVGARGGLTLRQETD